MAVSSYDVYVKVTVRMCYFCFRFVLGCCEWLFLYHGADIAGFVERVQQRLEVPRVEGSVKLSFELGHRWMLSWRFVVQVIEEAGCDVVWNYHLVFGFTWCEDVTVTCCNEKAIRS